MARNQNPSVRTSGRWPALSPQARSTSRLAVVAATVVATILVLILVALQARSAEAALDDAATHTLRDYAGYAGRMMGAELLRHFSEQRAAVLAPVSGSAPSATEEPSLDDIVERGNKSLASFGALADSGIGYFRLDLRTGAIDARGAMQGPIATRVIDTLRAIVDSTTTRDPEILAIAIDGVPYSVAYARLVDLDNHAIAMYGFTYTRSVFIAAVANLVFRETPLLPISFAGQRWNYDTTHVRPADVANDSLLGMRITDRAGHVLWQSRDQAAAASSPYSERVVLSTATGGIIVESALRQSSEKALLPGAVRRVQRWSLSALLILPVLLAAVSLLALRGERIGARARRAEAMQQLALGLRHELNNALASVMLNAELLGEDRALDPSLNDRLQAIVEQAERMRGVLRRLEKSDRLDVVVPYLNEGYMVDLSSTLEREHQFDLGDSRR